MGGCDFARFAEGENAQQAFDIAVKDALYFYGHGGYTGTIAEKHDFVMIPVPEGFDYDDKDAAMTFAYKLIDEGDPRIDDKWGPAGCISMNGNLYLFFGWASS